MDLSSKKISSEKIKKISEKDIKIQSLYTIYSTDIPSTENETLFLTNILLHYLHLKIKSNFINIYINDIYILLNFYINLLNVKYSMKKKIILIFYTLMKAIIILVVIYSKNYLKLKSNIFCFYLFKYLFVYT